MVTAIVLLNVRRTTINETAQQLLAIDGVTEVYSLAGEWDLAVLVRARNNDQLAAVGLGIMMSVTAGKPEITRE